MTALAQSPAIDVVGIGFASGEISIYDIRADEKIMRIFVREGPVRALAFRGGKEGLNICSLTRVLFLRRWTSSTCLCLGNGTYIPLGSRLRRAHREHQRARLVRPPIDDRAEPRENVQRIGRRLIQLVARAHVLATTAR